jgi:hypothetical protein
MLIFYSFYSRVCVYDCYSMSDWLSRLEKKTELLPVCSYRRMEKKESAPPAVGGDCV